MLTGGVGMASSFGTPTNSSRSGEIILALIYVGLVGGLLLDRLVGFIASKGLSQKEQKKLGLGITPTPFPTPLPKLAMSVFVEVLTMTC